MNRRATRAVRGTAAAGTAALVAGTAHTLAGGGAPSPLFLLAVIPLASPVAVALVGQRLAAWRVAGAVMVSQLLFHAAFAVAGSGGSSGSSPTARLGGHGHGASLGVVAASGSETATATAAHVMPDAPMLLAHLLAAALTTAVLVHGERMLQALGHGIRSLISLPAFTPSAPPRSARVAFALPTWAPLPVFASDVSRRGPPRS